MKQQVSALLWGEDLPEGAQAREVTRGPIPVTCCGKVSHGLPGVSTEVQDTPQADEAHGGAQRGEIHP